MHVPMLSAQWLRLLMFSRPCLVRVGGSVTWCCFLRHSPYTGPPDPVHAFDGPSYTMVANSAVVAIHTYHCLAFNLQAAEIFHHALFVTILCGLAIPYKQVGFSRTPASVRGRMTTRFRLPLFDTGAKWRPRKEVMSRGPPVGNSTCSPAPLWGGMGPSSGVRPTTLGASSCRGCREDWTM